MGYVLLLRLALYIENINETKLMQLYYVYTAKYRYILKDLLALFSY